MTVLSLSFLPAAAFATDFALSANVYVDSSAPTVNFGLSDHLSVDASRSAYIAFDMSKLDTLTGSNVHKAELKIYRTVSS